MNLKGMRYLENLQINPNKLRLNDSPVGSDKVIMKANMLEDV
jgi:hypothetical protein